MKALTIPHIQENIDADRKGDRDAGRVLNTLYSLMELSLLTAQGLEARQMGQLLVTTIPSLLQVPFAAVAFSEGGGARASAAHADGSALREPRLRGTPGAVVRSAPEAGEARTETFVQRRTRQLSCVSPEFPQASSHAWRRCSVGP